MLQQGQFILMNISEFNNWLKSIRVGRYVYRIQNHHTAIPGYSGFNGSNQFTMMQGMKDYHMGPPNNMIDIAQHFTTFPDGSIGTGRSLELNPAGIYGANNGAICMEHIGNFDIGADVMSQAQRDTIIFMNAALALKFNIAVNTNQFIYHHWFNLSTGAREDGMGGSTKSCPGTGFFGGNKVESANANFLPLIQNKIAELIKPPYPQWQLDCVNFLMVNGFITKLRLPDVVVDMGTLGYMFNNRLDKLNPVDPIAYLLQKGFIKGTNHWATEPLTVGTLGYILSNIDGVLITDPIAYMTQKGYITGVHTANKPLVFWLFGAVMNNFMNKRPF
jgi:hypothetical protein